MYMYIVSDIGDMGDIQVISTCTLLLEVVDSDALKGLERTREEIKMEPVTYNAFSQTRH
jgi:hypothetical protein